MISKKRKHQTIKQILTLGSHFRQSQDNLKEYIEDYLITNYNDFNSTGVLQLILNLDYLATEEYDWVVIQALPTYIAVDLLKIGSETDQLNREVILGIYEDLELAKFIDSKPEYWDEMDKSILTIASEIGSLELVSYTYLQTFRPNLKEETIIKAAANGYSNIIEFLIVNDLAALKAFGWEVFTDALYSCCEGGYIDVAKLLVDNNLYTYKGPKYNHFSALVPASRSGNLELCDFLVKEIRNHEMDYEIAVANAAECGHLHLVKYFEELGLNINRYNEPMMYACDGGQMIVIQYLLSKGSQFEPRFLVYALQNSHFEVAQFIMNNGIDLVSAVSCAAEEKMIKCVRCKFQLKSIPVFQLKESTI